MTRAVRSAVGLLRLRLEVSRASWIMLAFYGLALPMGFFAWGRSSASSPGARLQVLVGTLLFSALLVMIRRLAQTSAMERFGGIWEVLSANGVNRGLYLAASAIDGLILAVIPVLGAFAVCLAWPELAPQGFAWMVPYALAVVSFGAVGLLLAGVCGSAPIASMAGNLVVVLSVALCPLLYAADRVPDGLRPIVEWLPQSLAALVLRASWQGEAVPLVPFSALLAWALVLVGCVAYRFPWVPRH